MTHFSAVRSQAAKPLVHRPLTAVPLLLKCGRTATITLKITGMPPPRVSWLVGGRVIAYDDPNYIMQSDQESNYSLVIAMASDELDGGLEVRAINSVGQDSFMLPIKTFRLLSGHTPCSSPIMTNSPSLSRHSTQIEQREVKTYRIYPKTQTLPIGRSSRSQSTADYNHWQREMESRTHQIRSVDDLLFTDSDDDEPDTTAKVGSSQKLVLLETNIDDPEPKHHSAVTSKTKKFKKLPSVDKQQPHKQQEQMPQSTVHNNRKQMFIHSEVTNDNVFLTSTPQRQSLNIFTDDNHGNERKPAASPIVKKPVSQSISSNLQNLMNQCINIEKQRLDSSVVDSCSTNLHETDSSLWNFYGIKLSEACLRLLKDFRCDAEFPNMKTPCSTQTFQCLSSSVADIKMLEKTFQKAEYNEDSTHDQIAISAIENEIPKSKLSRPTENMLPKVSESTVDVTANQTEKQDAVKIFNNSVISPDNTTTPLEPNNTSDISPESSHFSQNLVDNTTAQDIKNSLCDILLKPGALDKCSDENSERNSVAEHQPMTVLNITGSVINAVISANCATELECTSESFDEKPKNRDAELLAKEQQIEMSSLEECSNESDSVKFKPATKSKPAIAKKPIVPKTKVKFENGSTLVSSNYFSPTLMNDEKTVVAYKKPPIIKEKPTLLARRTETIASVLAKNIQKKKQEHIVSLNLTDTCSVLSKDASNSELSQVSVHKLSPTLELVTTCVEESVPAENASALNRSREDVLRQGAVEKVRQHQRPELINKNESSAFQPDLDNSSSFSVAMPAVEDPHQSTSYSLCDINYEGCNQMQVAEQDETEQCVKLNQSKTNATGESAPEPESRTVRTPRNSSQSSPCLLPVIYQNLTGNYRSSETFIIRKPPRRPDASSCGTFTTVRRSRSQSSERVLDAMSPGHLLSEVDFSMSPSVIDDGTRSCCSMVMASLNPTEHPQKKPRSVTRSPTPDREIKSGESGAWKERKLTGCRSAEQLGCNIQGLVEYQGLQRRALSKEWRVVTTVTVNEEVTVVQRPPNLMVDSAKNVYANLPSRQPPDQTVCSTAANDQILPADNNSSITVRCDAHNSSKLSLSKFRPEVILDKNNDRTYSTVSSGQKLENIEKRNGEVSKSDCSSSELRYRSDGWDIITTVVTDMVRNTELDSDDILQTDSTTSMMTRASESQLKLLPSSTEDFTDRAITIQVKQFADVESIASLGKEISNEMTFQKEKEIPDKIGGQLGVTCLDTGLVSLSNSDMHKTVSTDSGRHLDNLIDSLMTTIANLD